MNSLPSISTRGRSLTRRFAISVPFVFAWLLVSGLAQAQLCEREITANIVALDQPVVFNRLGASNVNGMIFALERDVINKASRLTLNNGGLAAAGNVALRPDKRPRPLILRVREGDCLTINLTNLLTPNENSIKPGAGEFDPLPGPGFLDEAINTPIDEQVLGRNVSFQVAGMEWVNGQTDAASFVGMNDDSTVPQGGMRSYKLYAAEEGTFVARGMASTVGSDANQGNSSNLLLGQVTIEPRGARIYRSQLTEEEMRLASMNLDVTDNTADANGVCGDRNLTADLQPIVNYEAVYPSANCGNGNSLGDTVWAAEGKAGLPILNMIQNNEIVHSVLNAIVAGPDDDGSWKSVCPDGDPFEGACPYPLESIGKRNPTLPNRLEAFREYGSAWHDEVATAQPFPGFFVNDPVFKYVLAGVKDAFMINYGSGGIGSEIIANRLGVGPMHDCLACAYEEFFLTSFAVGDPAQLANVSANIGLEQLAPGDTPDPAAVGPKATWVPFPDDPANVAHSYTGDFVKIRNTHVGNENHVFHLHNHQWLYNPNDDNSNYLDAQGIGPGASYTYEINFGGSGNRMKSSGDAIFHCHFYPHFAQGMWYMWRNHDVMETGTPLQASGTATSFHATPYGLVNGMPLTVGTDARGLPIRARALPDGEIVAGAPIPALVPLPGKAMPPMPGEVQVVANALTTTASAYNPDPGPDLDGTMPGIQVPVGSLAKVVQRDVNPGYPFWIAGVEDTVGQRPPTPPLDMLDAGLAAALNVSATDTIQVRKANGPVPVDDAACELANDCTLVKNLFSELVPAQAGGFNGGLPRSTVAGYAAGGMTAANVVSRLDFSKVMAKAQAVYFPEEGTDIEHVAMAYHAVREHPSYAVDMLGNVAPANYILNGNKPAVGAPYHEPCMDDQGDRFDDLEDPLSATSGIAFWGADAGTWIGEDDSANVNLLSPFTAEYPRIYKGANMQFDAVLNKLGYHYPQQRIIALWEDVVPVITKAKPPEPMVLRFNTFDCGVYQHTNLVPEYYELDDYQVRTPTDIIGQHIHLPKWDLTTADGAANGWNYEDGTLSPGAVQERIEAINHYVDATHDHKWATGSPAGAPLPGELLAASHPFFGLAAPPGTLEEKWKGARTTLQRWFFDPVLNSDGIDRGLGIIFTHDHYGPSTHQQVGLYATVLAEPANSTWAHNETGEQLGCRSPADTNCRADGGPTSWQAAIVPPASTTVNPAGQLEAYREFYFEYSDFQHAYEAGVYVGADQNGEQLPMVGPGADMVVKNEGNPLATTNPQEAFRFAINPPGQAQNNPVYPDIRLEGAGAAAGGTEIVDICPERPCPMAIDAADPGMFAVNYRNEPVGLRVYDPNKIGPDGKPGMQADGLAGDLAFALQSRTDRAIPEMNGQPVAGSTINGTKFPPPINTGQIAPGDPFTPMMRTYVGDIVRVKKQAGGDEEEHDATIHGLKWLQAGSGYGEAPNSGWRNNQAGGISEQFSMRIPLVPVEGDTRQAANDYLYSMDASQDGWWSGLWGIMRAYELNRTDLIRLPNGGPVAVSNESEFKGVCPISADVREFDITAAAANDILPANVNVGVRDALGVLTQLGIQDLDPNGHVGNAPAADGGTLVYNPRTTRVGGQTITDPETLEVITLAEHFGPIHDPTALLYVYTDDLEEAAAAGSPEWEECNRMGVYYYDSPELTHTLISRRRVSGNRYAYDYTYSASFSGSGTGVSANVTSNANGITVVEGHLEFGAVPGSSGTDTYTLRWDRRYPFDGNKIEFEFEGEVDGDGGGVRNAACPVRLRPGVKVEPLILRAAAGECIDVTLRNRLPAVANELPNKTLLIGAVKRDRFGLQGATTFQSNLVQTSGYAGLHPQLVAFDVSRANGILVGINESGEHNSYAGVAPPEGGIERMRWYAGDLDIVNNGTSYELVATPVEFGTANLQPADVIKQGTKSLYGQLVIEPEVSTWVEDATGRQSATVTYTPPGGAQTTFRDFPVVLAKGLTHFFADGTAVEHIGGEGADGIPEDSQADSAMAINYGIEPIWFRLGLLPNAPFGHAGSGPATFGGSDQLDVYSNNHAGVNGDPATPVFIATAGQEARMRLGVPHGTNRGTTFQLHGHTWQRDPYLAQYVDAWGFPRAYALGGPGVGSVRIGHNPLGFYVGGQESLFPTAHYDVVLPSAGGSNATQLGCTAENPCDFMFRDVASANVASGLWGILRLGSALPPPATE